MKNRLAIYLRCSTLDQNLDAQRHELRNWAKFKKLTIVEEYKDEGISGMKSVVNRPQFSRMMKDAAKGKFDMVAVWDMTRFGRSTADIAANIDQLVSLGVHLYAATQGLDTTTPFGETFMKVVGTFAELETKLRAERCKAGQDRARAMGRPLGPSASDEPVEQLKDKRIAELILKGRSYAYIRDKERVGNHRIRRVRNTHELLKGVLIP